MTRGVSGSLGVTMANMKPRGMVGRIYIVNHYALLHTGKYRSCTCASWSHSEFKKVFPHYKSMEANDPHGHGWDHLCRGSLDITIY